MLPPRTGSSTPGEEGSGSARREGPRIVTTPTGSRWLSLSDLATAEGVTERTIRARLDSARFPAPSRFSARRGALWDAKHIEAFGVGEHPAFWEDGNSREQWLARLLDEVRWWVWKHGTARIPTSARGRGVGPQTSRLGPRVTKVRALHRQGEVPSRVAAAFEALPEWSWNEKTAAWQRRLDDVLTRWPTRLSGRDKAWLASQRARLSTMPADRAAALRKVPGMVEFEGNRRVHEFVEAVTVWLGENPGATVADLPYSATVEVHGDIVPVGRRAGYYRRRYLGKESSRSLRSDEVALIEALPGWSWEQSRRHVTAAAR